MQVTPLYYVPRRRVLGALSNAAIRPSVWLVYSTQIELNKLTHTRVRKLEFKSCAVNKP